MRYSELKRIVDNHDGYHFKTDANKEAVYIMGHFGDPVVLYSNGAIAIDIRTIPSVHFPTEILRAVADVMDTPLEERAEPQLYYVHLLPRVSGYLQYDSEHGAEVFYTGSLNYLDEGQHDFTPSEINVLADKYPNTAIPHFDKNNPMFEEVSEDE